MRAGASLTLLLGARVLPRHWASLTPSGEGRVPRHLVTGVGGSPGSLTLPCRVGGKGSRGPPGLAGREGGSGWRRAVPSVTSCPARRALSWSFARESSVWWGLLSVPVGVSRLLAASALSLGQQHQRKTQGTPAVLESWQVCLPPSILSAPLGCFLCGIRVVTCTEGRRTPLRLPPHGSLLPVSEAGPHARGFRDWPCISPDAVAASHHPPCFPARPPAASLRAPFSCRPGLTAARPAPDLTLQP